MSVTLVTGSTGLVGSYVARLLAERGDDLRLTVREGSPLGGIADIDADLMTARRALRHLPRRARRATSAALGLFSELNRRL